MGRDKVRVVILCEDLAQGHFVRAICEHAGHPVRLVVAPRGQGSGEQWVRKRYPDEVKAYRAYKRERVALVTVIDGDKEGVAKRKDRLADALTEASHQARQEGERLAICVPTWSIETWFAWLCELDGVSETVSWKDNTRLKEAQRQGRASPTKAAEAWRRSPREGEATSVPSLPEARVEMQRLKD